MTLHFTVTLLLSACAVCDDAAPADSRGKDVEVEASAPLALDGYCPVTVVDESRWRRGDEQFTAVHEGCLYQFAGEDEQQTFLKSPTQYTVALEGYDIVRYADSGALVAGRRNFGLFLDSIYLLADEASRVKYENDPQRYSDAAKELAKLAKETGFSLRQRAAAQARDFTAEVALTQFDRDGDKRLAPDELAASIQAIKVLAAAFDTDGDGALSEAELAAAIERFSRP